MKRYLSLALALILALAVFCGVSVFAEDAEVDVNRLPTCPHLYEEVSTTYYTWHEKSCTIDCRKVKTLYKCVICSFEKTESYEETKDANPTHHDWKEDGKVQRNGIMCTRYKCTKCGTYDIR